ncbi:ATP-binding protein [Streptomyces sp. NPDC058611]|uniref:ATP-binding protein n=1 Tax=unclassified Streptomyces TaxID=2593676 RepID=UPI003665BE07
MTAPFGPPAALVRLFTQRFSATRRGARLARTLALHELHDWGYPPSAPLAADAGLLIGELAANAVLHGRVPGRDFELRLVLLDAVLRIEVSDARADRRPAVGPYTDQAESGHGLRIVAALAAGWGVVDRLVGKTVWAELPLAGRSAGQVPPAGGLVAGMVGGHVPPVDDQLGVLEDVPVDLGADVRRERVPDGGHDPARGDGAEAPTR